MQLSPDVERLAQPVRTWLDEALAKLNTRTDFQVELGELAGFWQREGLLIRISAQLNQAATQHPIDAAYPEGLDKWRRLLASILEACVDASLRQSAPTWLRLAVATYQVDALIPSIQLLRASFAARFTGDLQAHPREGVFVLRSWDHRPDVALDKAQDLLGHVVTPGDLLPAAALIVASNVAQPMAWPMTLPPWQLRRHRLTVPQPGLCIQADDGGAVSPQYIPPDQVHDLMLVSADRTVVMRESLGAPPGSWRLATVDGFGRVLGSRGILLTLTSSGRVEIVLADAFVGGLDDLPAALQMGTSGIVLGRWHIVGTQEIAFDELDTRGLTLHARSGRAPMAMPVGSGGLAAGLAMLEKSTWRWRMTSATTMTFAGQVHLDPAVNAPNLHAVRVVMQWAQSTDKDAFV